MSKLFSKFEELAIGLAKATMIGGTLLDKYIRSLLSVSFLVVFVYRQMAWTRFFIPQEKAGNCWVLCCSVEELCIVAEGLPRKNGDTIF